MELVFNVIAFKGEIGYASDFERNGLFEVNIKTGECRYIGIFPNEENMIKRLHEHALWIENKVFFIPSSGKNISVFNTDSETVETIEVPGVVKKHGDNYKPKLKFAKAVEYNGFLWVIPATYPGILKLNLYTYEISLINNWIPNDRYMFRRAVRCRGNMIYAASGNNNNVLMFDMDSETAEMVKVGNFNNGIADMCECGENFFMAPRRRGAVIRWNPKSNEIEEFNKYPEKLDYGRVAFNYIYKYNFQFVLVPANANYGIRLSEGKLYIDNDIQWKKDSINSIDFMFETKNKIYFREYFGDSYNRVYFIDKKKNILVDYNFNIVNSEERLKDIAKNLLTIYEIAKESTSYGLREWLKGID